MGFLILVRWHLFIESAPRFLTRGWVTKYRFFPIAYVTVTHISSRAWKMNHIPQNTITYPRPIYLLMVPNSYICSILWTVLLSRKLNLRLLYRTTTGSLFTKRTTSNLRISWSSKPWDSALDSSNRSEIWQTSRQQRSKDVCHILERCDYYVIQSRDLAVRCLTA